MALSPDCFRFPEIWSATAPAHGEAGDPEDQEDGGDPPKGLHGEAEPEHHQDQQKEKNPKDHGRLPDRGKFLSPRGLGEAASWDASTE
ncbi:hypothetical protein ACF07B_13495 [Streptomyces sp. NPDC015532]|uniref:hypothetical protein n=1 Tax=Streptomyces sp. NPDC015532 TaxID=3364960 RepID=UPI0036FC67D8